MRTLLRGSVGGRLLEGVRGTELLDRSGRRRGRLLRDGRQTGLLGLRGRGVLGLSNRSPLRGRRQHDGGQNSFFFVFRDSNPSLSLSSLYVLRRRPPC